MTAHELAKKLLEGPDLKVTIARGVHSSYEAFEWISQVDAFGPSESLWTPMKGEDNSMGEPHIHIS